MKKWSLEVTKQIKKRIILEKLKQEYKEIFEKTRQLVHDWDPCSLIDADAPTDEYDSLTNKLLSGVINQVDINTLTNDIIKMLDNHYGTPVYNELTKENQQKLRIEIKDLIEKIIKTNANSRS